MIAKKIFFISSPRTTYRLVGTLIVLFFIGMVARIHDVSAIVYGGIGGRPAYPRAENPRTKDIFVHTLAPGATQDEGVVVLNNTAETKTVMVYSADAAPSTDGGFACRQLAEPQTEVGAWIRFGEPQLAEAAGDLGELKPDEDADGDGLTNAAEATAKTNPRNADTDGDGVGDKQEVDAGTPPDQPVVLTLAAGTNATIPFSITMPSTASVGEHDGCVLIQEKKNGGTDQGIGIATRTGLRVAITVPGTIKRDLEIVGLEIRPRANGGKIIHPVVRNTGNVSIDADVRVTTKNLFGQVIQQHGGVYPILRDDTSEWNFELAPRFWGGIIRTSITVAYAADPSTELGVPDEKETVIVGPTVRYLLWPTPAGAGVIAAIILAVLALLGTLWMYLKRQRMIAATWVPYTTKTSDTIQGLAKQYNVSWKLLARANSLRAPYELAPRTSLRVPPTAARPAKSKKKVAVKSKKQ